MDKPFITEDGKEITSDMFDTLAEPWDRGELIGLPGPYVSTPGRPPHNVETKLVALRFPVAMVEAIDAKAKAKGVSRSQCVRDAVWADLIKA